MQATVKFVFVTMLALLLFCTPIGACMNTMKTAEAPSHPCCPAKPASLPDDCARPGCVYMDTHIATDVQAPADAGLLVAELPAVPMEPALVTVVAPVATVTPPGVRQRVVLFQQFLI